MLQRERLNDPEEALRAALDGFQARIWTAMPASLVSFDPATVSCKAQPTIKGQVLDPAGTWTDVTMPLCVDCPVIFPAGGGFALTFPLAAGDEGLLVFASRCINAWWSLGGVQTQEEFRMHDLSDGFFIPGAFSKPRIMPGPISATTAQLRNADGTLMIELAGGDVCNIVAPGGINLVGPVTMADLTVTGGTSLQALTTTTIDADGHVLATGSVEAGVGSGDHVTMQSHRHTSGSVGNPTSVPTPGT